MAKPNWGTSKEDHQSENKEAIMAITMAKVVITKKNHNNNDENENKHS